MLFPGVYEEHEEEEEPSLSHVMSIFLMHLVCHDFVNPLTEILDDSFWSYLHL